MNLKHTQNRVKDPDSRRWYSINWISWLEDDQIQTSVWIVPPELQQYETEQTPFATRVRIGGGIPREEPYRITNRITTVQGDTEDCSLFLRVVEK